MVCIVPGLEPAIMFFFNKFLFQFCSVSHFSLFVCLCLNGSEDLLARWLIVSSCSSAPFSWHARSGVTLSKIYVIAHRIRLTVHALCMRSTTTVNQQRCEVSLLCPEGTQTLTPVQISQIFSSCLQLHTTDRC